MRLDTVRSILLIVLATGCGRIGFAGASDGGGSDAAAPIDAGAADADGGTASDGGAVEEGGVPLDAGETAFRTIRVIAELADPEEDSEPCMTSDGTELYFASRRLPNVGSLDTWRSIRASVTEPWGSPEPVPELTSSFGDVGCSLSEDGLTLWLTQQPPGARDIYATRRPTRSSPWGPLVAVASLNSPEDDLSPAPFLGDTRIVFHSTRPGAGESDLYEAMWTGSDWSTPVHLSVLNTEAWEGSAYVTPDGRTIYFTRGGMNPDFERTILRSTRDDIGSLFREPVPVPELSPGTYDDDVQLLPDGSYAVFNSDATGNREIWEAIR